MGEMWVKVSANVEYGMATIWDVNVLIWAVSQIIEACDNGLPTSPELKAAS